jgi:hypothetical protein
MYGRHKTHMMAFVVFTGTLTAGSAIKKYTFMFKHLRFINH